jgi:hypothetical protein
VSEWSGGRRSQTLKTQIGLLACSLVVAGQATALAQSPSCPVTAVPDGTFEAGPPWPSWTTQSSTNFGTPLCDAGCGTGNGTAGPHSGSYWAWFGGISETPETAAVGQTLVLPRSGDLKLRFQMRVGFVSGPYTDTLTIRVDGAVVHTFQEPAAPELSYSPREVDLTPFADGNAHSIAFTYQHPDAGVANFSVDSIELVDCLPITKRGTQITYLPFEITAQGAYYIAQNLSTSLTSGAAITISADFVVLDLKGFKLGGGGAGPATATKGVYALNRKNVIVKNGNIRGFFQGVLLEGASGGNHVVENIRADGNTYAGIWVEGKGNVVRRNQVISTTGTTLFANPDAFGIVAHGSGVKILDNDVTDTFGTGTGIGRGIQVNAGAGSILERNRVSNSIASPSRGIEVLGSSDSLVSNNRLLKLDLGLFFDSPTGGKYKNNLSSGVTTPYTGGIDAGNNQ